MATKFKDYPLVFIHLPKTGGVWVEGALRASGIRIKRFGHEHGTFDRMEIEEMTLNGVLPLFLAQKLHRGMRRFGKDKPPPKRFSVVRHPLKWYESFWRYKMDLNGEYWGRENQAAYWHPNSALNGLESKDFNEFMRKVIAKRPGYVSELYFSFIKPSVDWVARTESLSDDLVRILNIAGVDFNEKLLRLHPRANESKTPSTKVKWDPKLRDITMRLELPALIHFDYLTNEEKEHYGISGGSGKHPGLVC